MKILRNTVCILVAIALAASVAYGAATYPTAIKSFISKNTGDIIQATDVNQGYDEITSIETGLLNGLQHVLKPSTTNTYDLGTALLQWRTGYFGTSVLVNSGNIVGFLGLPSTTPDSIGVADGTSGVSITSTGPTVTMERFDASTAGAVNTVPGYLFVTKRTGGTTGATYNVLGYAESSAAGTQVDIVGLAGIAQQLAGSTSRPFGVYGESRLNANPVSGSAIGAEFDVINQTGLTAPVIGDTVVLGSTIGLQIVGNTSGVGSSKNSSGISILSKISSATNQFLTGVFFGTNSVQNYGIDMHLAAPAFSAILLPNNIFLAGRNVTNTGDIGILKLGGDNTTRFDNDLAFIFETFTGGNAAFRVNAVASSVDYLTAIPSVTGNPATVSLSAVNSTDANVNLNLVSRGTGVVQANGVTVAVAPTVTLKSGSGAGSYASGVGTAYVDVDATNLAFTVTVPTGQKIVISASGTAFGNSSSLTSGRVALTDGTTLLREIVLQGNLFTPYAINYVFAGDGASHTFKLRFHGDASFGMSIENTTSTDTPTMVFIMQGAN